MGAIPKNIKIVLIVIAVAFLGYVGYSYLTGDAPSTTSTNPDAGLSSQAVGDSSEIGKRLLVTLDTISSLKLDKGILTSEAFMSLQDLSTEITPQPVGRDNPFLPTRIAPTTPVRRR